MRAIIKYVQLAPTIQPLEAMQDSQGEQGAAIRSLCHLLDISRPTQMVRIKHNRDLAVALHHVTIDTPGGPQQVAMLESWAIAVWLTGLHTSRLSPASQEVALLLKQHAYSAIQQAFETEPATPQTAREQTSRPPVADPFQLLQAGIGGLQQSFVGLERRIDLLEAMQTPRRYGSAGGLSAYQIGQVYLLLRLLRDTTGVSLEEAEKRLASAFGVAHLTDVDAAQWEALLTRVHSLFQQ